MCHYFHLHTHTHTQARFGNLIVPRRNMIQICEIFDRLHPRAMRKWTKLNVFWRGAFTDSDISRTQRAAGHAPPPLEDAKCNEDLLLRFNGLDNVAMLLGNEEASGCHSQS